MTTARIPFRLSAITTSLLAATVLISPDAALAQAAAPGDAPAADAPAKVQVVTVTAERRSENIKQVPSSITAIGGGQLEDLGAARIDDFVSKVPGLNFVGGRPGNRQLILRGISSGGDQQNATVGTYIDEVPIGSSTSLAQGSRVKPDIDTFDLDRLEVLRGPQGTLYGANSLGGLLKYVTAQPDPKRLFGYGRAEVMSVAHGGTGFGVNAGLNAPLGADSAIRASAFSRTEPGYIDNIDPVIGKKDVNKLKTSGARVAFAFKPTTDFTVRLAAMNQKFDTDGEPTEDVSLPTGQPVEGRYEQDRHTPEASRQNFNLYSLTLDWDLAGGKLLSVTSWNKVTYRHGTDWTAIDGLGQDDPDVPLANEVDSYDTTKATQEFRYSSPKSDVFEWMVGAFWTREQTSLLQVEKGYTGPGVVAPPPNDLYFRDTLQGTYTQKALYANARYYFSPKFDVGFGLRGTRDDTRATDVLGGLFAEGSYQLDQSSSFNSFMLAPRYRLDDDTMIYARAASASRPGGPNSLSAEGIAAGANQTFGPDHLTSYEAGIKSTSSGGRFGFDLTAFYIDWKDIQIRSTVGTFAFIGNGGKAKSQGVEATLMAYPLDDLTLSLNAAIVDAELVDDAPAVGGAKGDQLPNNARLSAAASADYEFAGIGSSRAYVGAAVRHVGDRLENFVRDGTRDRLTLPAYNTLDLRAGFRWSTWDLNFYVKNATDTHIVETLTTNFTPASAAIGRPRTIGAFATVRF